MLETRLPLASPSSSTADTAVPNLPPTVGDGRGTMPPAVGRTTLTREEALGGNKNGDGDGDGAAELEGVRVGPSVGLDVAMDDVGWAEERGGEQRAPLGAPHRKANCSSTEEVGVGDSQAGSVPRSSSSAMGSSSSPSSSMLPAGPEDAVYETVAGRRVAVTTGQPAVATGAFSFTPASASPSPSPPPSSPLFSSDMASLSSENPALDNLFRVFLVFQEMRSRGVTPDLRAYNALVNTCADLGEFDRALGVVRQMVDDDHGGGLQPDAVTYTSLIKAAARATPPRVEEAEEVRCTWHVI